jgi:hypothetical protein
MPCQFVGHILSQIYFGKELYMFRADLLSIIRSLNTVYTAIDICRASYGMLTASEVHPDLASRQST